MVLGRVADACALIVSGCVDTNLGYTLLGEADERLLEDDVEGLQTILASDGQEKRGIMLVFGCLHGARRCAKYLVSQGAMPDVDMAACGHILDKFTPITIAGLLGHWDVVDALVEGGAEVYAFDRHGYSALSVAAIQYPEGNLESLLRRRDIGMHINKDNLNYLTALMVASAPAVPLLVEAGANVNLETEVGTALFQACDLASLEYVKALVENGADNRHATSGKTMTPLMVAAENGHADIVEYLLAQPSTDINAKAAGGGRAIDFACRTGHLEVVKILVAAGSRVEADATNEWSPLVAAIVEGDLVLVKYLVEEAGVDIQRPAFFCTTPLMLAQRGCQTGAVAEYLQEVISQREQLHDQQALLAAEEKAAVARAALLEKEARAAAAAAALLEELDEEDRAAAAKEASTKKKKKKGKQKGGATAPMVTPSPPSQERGSRSTPEVSNTVPPDVTQTLAAVLASTTIGNEGLGGPREGMSTGGSSVVAGADAEESGGQHVGPASGPSQPADYKETPSEAIKNSTEAGIEEALLEGLSCPISFQLMTDPVSAEDGHTYEQAAIQEWIDKCRADKRELTSPLTGAPMGTGLRPNLLVRSIIRNLVRSNLHGT